MKSSKLEFSFPSSLSSYYWRGGASIIVFNPYEQCLGERPDFKEGHCTFVYSTGHANDYQRFFTIDEKGDVTWIATRFNGNDHFGKGVKNQPLRIRRFLKRAIEYVKKQKEASK